MSDLGDHNWGILSYLFPTWSSITSLPWKLRWLTKLWKYTILPTRSEASKVQQKARLCPAVLSSDKSRSRDLPNKRGNTTSFRVSSRGAANTTQNRSQRSQSTQKLLVKPVMLVAPELAWLSEWFEWSSGRTGPSMDSYSWRTRNLNLNNLALTLVEVINLTDIHGWSLILIDIHWLSSLIEVIDIHWFSEFIYNGYNLCKVGRWMIIPTGFAGPKQLAWCMRGSETMIGNPWKSPIDGWP